MRKLFHKQGLVILALAAGICVLLFGIDYYRHRFVRSDADLFRFLPAGDATKFFADVRVLRRAGFLELIAGRNVATAADYQQFVRETHFDYKRDLQAIAGTVAGESWTFMLRGRFDWTLLKQYASQHGGTCESSRCTMLSTRSDRVLFFTSIQPDVLALFTSGDRQPHLSAGRRSEMLSMDPLWVSLSSALLRDPRQLHVALRIFAITVESAHPVVVSLAGSSLSNTEFELRLRAHCATLAMAETTRTQLDIQTKMIKLELAREHQEPNPGDLSGLVTSGIFQIVNKDVIGTWPVNRRLLDSLLR